MDELTVLSGNIGCILARWQKWSKVSLKGSEVRFRAAKKGKSEFAPLWSDYDKTVYYNTYDVTEQLRRGENVVGILLGNGFYNVQGGRYRKLQISFGPPTLLFELVINYEDGTCTTVHSDNNWKYDFSPSPEI
mgnify:CR=1 FL=1